MKSFVFFFILSQSLWALEPEKCYWVQEGSEGGLLQIVPKNKSTYYLITSSLEMEATLESRVRSITENQDVYKTREYPPRKLIFDGKRSDFNDPYSEQGTLDFAGQKSRYKQVKCRS